MSNSQSLSILHATLKSGDVDKYIDSVLITTTTSFEGDVEHNKRLAADRAKGLRNYLNREFPHISNDKIKLNPNSENISIFENLVRSYSDIPKRAVILDILNQDLSLPIKIQNLKNIDNGISWNYIQDHFFRYLRSGIISIQFYVNDNKEESIVLDDKTIGQPTLITTHKKEATNHGDETSSLIFQSQNEDQYLFQSIRPFALKTNLLFDLATILNVEMEIPVAPRWSIAGEVIFPWWLNKSKQNCVQIFSGNIEARYWLKPKYSNQDIALGNHNPMTGWFLGLYGGAGYYDLEWNKKGYQGDFFIATGISAGYVAPLSRNLNLEFSLGLGYLKTNYDYYKAQQDTEQNWHLIKQYSGNYTWIGPTKAKISLIWYPHIKKKRNRR